MDNLADCDMLLGTKVGETHAHVVVKVQSSMGLQQVAITICIKRNKLRVLCVDT